MIKKIQYKLAKIAESHPYIWWVAWTIANELPICLPHDKSYFALRHFGDRPNGMFLDIGANTGISALSFRRLNPTMKILSIEPNAIHENRLNAIQSRVGNFEYKMIGVGDKEEEVTMFTPVYGRVVLHTFTSGSEDQVHEAVTKSFGKRIAQELKILRSTAKIMRIDDLALEPSIIKIDAEGFDYNVLLGAKQTIEKYRPFLMVEVAHSELAPFQDFFSKLQYGLFAYDYIEDSFKSVVAGSLNYESGNRNLFALPHETESLLPILHH